jgi:hypothetical protein
VALPLQALVRGGCPRDLLAMQLRYIADFARDDSHKRWVGMNGRDVDRTVARLRREAEEIDRLTKTLLIYSLGPEVSRKFQAIPPLLREFSDAIGGHWGDKGRSFGPKRRRLQNGAKAALVATVMHHTGRPHDEEVSALLGAVMNKLYTTENHKMWRRNHRALIEQAQSQRAQAAARWM